MAETQVTTTEGPTAEPLASSAETTAIAEKVGEHEVKLTEAQQTAQEAAATAAAAAAVAETPTAHSHEEYATKADLQGLGDRLAGVLEERLPKPPPEPPVTEPKPQDKPPKSMEKHGEKKAERPSLADRFYGRTKS